MSSIVGASIVAGSVREDSTPRFGERLAVMLPKEVVDLPDIDGAHQKPHMALFGLREQLSDNVASGLATADPLENCPRIKDASLHARALVS